ncbi:MAG TPA: DivIVA domain-containing protein [Gemmatimonadales bacterium]|jgi:DivIVA domain-containing protein
MNDEAFRLTPADIRQQEFRKAFTGYDHAVVEEFRQRVADELERVLMERAQLEERIQGLREQLKSFREREKALNDAVVVAQQLREETAQAAQREREVVLREAKLQAEGLLGEARKAEAEVRVDIAAAQRQFTGYVAAFRQLLLRRLAELDALAEHESDGSAPDGSHA